MTAPLSTACSAWYAVPPVAGGKAAPLGSTVAATPPPTTTGTAGVTTVRTCRAESHTVPLPVVMAVASLVKDGRGAPPLTRMPTGAESPWIRTTYRRVVGAPV